MKFPKSFELNNYDVFPSIVAAGKETVMHIRPLGGRRAFVPGENYKLTVAALSTGRPRYFPTTADFQEVPLCCDENGGFTFTHTFKTEQEYFLRIPFINKNGKEERRQFSVYCVEGELVGRYPFIGDTHIHTCCSDGAEQPETVCASYRQNGYDFLTVSDHERYYPSLQAMAFYKEVPTDFVIVPGEEVHMLAPDGSDICDVHIVNFGGEYSINALVEGLAIEETGRDKKYRSIREDCPDIMTKDAFYELIQARMAEMNVPEGVDPLCAAVVAWVFEQIKQANGLGIFAHPFWFNDVQNVPDAMIDYIIENNLLDASEVIGGEHYYDGRYYEQNRLQVLRYHDDRARGYHYAVVGGSDSHSCHNTNPDALISSTMVFSAENERKALIDAIKNFYSIAIDTFNKEIKLVGELRLARYGNFLLKHYFPLHDELCFEEGRLMKQYATGTAEEKKEALDDLKRIHGRIKRLQRKYFSF